MLLMCGRALLRASRYWTLQVAISDAIKSPCASFADPLRQHFRHKRELITQQCRTWLSECRSSSTTASLKHLVGVVEGQLKGL